MCIGPVLPDTLKNNTTPQYPEDPKKPPGGISMPTRRVSYETGYFYCIGSNRGMSQDHSTALNACIISCVVCGPLDWYQR